MQERNRGCETPADAAMKTYSFTHVGRREENQDRLKVLQSADGGEFLLAVADGLGGHSGGALAAQTIVETVERCWESRGADADGESFLRRLTSECHAAVNKAGEAAGLEPRSTLAALHGRGGEIVSVHAGDSRVIQFSGTGKAKRTFDHSIAQLNVLRGLTAEEDMATHPDQKKLFCHLGGEETPDAEYEHWDPAQGVRFVICSDGFWEVFPPDEIVALFAEADPAAAMERRFAEKLERLPKHDNTTAILAEIPAPRRRKSWFGRILPRAALASALCAAPAALAAQEVAEGEGGGREGGAEQSSGQGEAPAPRQTESGRRQSPDGPVALDDVYIETDREIAPGGGVARTAEDELRKNGKIGPDDDLAETGKSRKVAGKTIVRLRQRHKGVPVYAGEVTVVAADGRISVIQGGAAPVSGVDPVPFSDYICVLDLAGERLGKRIEARDEGALVVFALAPERFRMAWEGVAAVDGVEARMVFDARTGEILLRLPVAIDAVGGGGAKGGPDAPR